MCIGDSFPDLMNPGFTARMEDALDEISIDSARWLPYLDRFFRGEAGLEQQVAQREGDIDPFSLQASALDCKWFRERVLSNRICFESIRSRFKIESRAHALESKSNREHLPWAHFHSKANALDSISNREQLLSIRFQIESTCSRLDFESRAPQPNSGHI